MNRSSKLAIIGGALLIWYTLIGFCIAPPLIRHFGESYLQTHFSPKSTIAKVRINPFSGAFRVEGLDLRDAEGAWSVAWQQAELNLGAGTFFKWYPVVDVLRLDGADIRYEKRLTEARAEVESEVPQSSRDWRDWAEALNLAEVPELRVDLLVVSEGRIEFSDLTAAAPYHKTVHPINFSLKELTTVQAEDSAMSFLAETDQGGTVRWEGDLRSQPIRSRGHFALDGLAVHDFSPYFKQYIQFDLRRALFGLSFDYDLNFSDLDNLLQIRDGRVYLNYLTCVSLSEASERLLTADSIQAERIDFSFPQMTLVLGSFTITNAETRILKNASGELNLAHLIIVPTDADVESIPEAPRGEASLPPITYTVERMVIDNYRITWMDELEGGAAQLEVAVPQMELTGFSSDWTAPIQLQADSLIGDAGQIRIEGQVTPAGPVLDLGLEVQSLPLELLSPYANHFGKTTIKQGSFDFDGRVHYEATGKQALSGSASIRELDLNYAGKLQTVWTALSLNGMELNVSPFELGMETVTLEQPHVVYDYSVGAEESAPTENEVSSAPDSSAMPVRIESFSLSEGRFMFKDGSFTPAAEVVMDSIGLDVSGLDLTGGKPAKLTFNTEINGSHFSMNGNINLHQLKEATQLSASLSGLSMPALSPYSGRAVGRRIANGQFNLVSDWSIQESQLKASNQIRIEQFELGDRVESPDAVLLPLDLAVTLLKGPNGVMDISLPLSGDLSDPKVGIWQIVRTAAVGLITNVASAPFKILSNLVGAEEDLSMVEFAPGQSELSSDMLKRLNALAQALKARSGLTLAITPYISELDEIELSKRQLRFDLLGEAKLSDEKLYRKRLTKRYRDAMQAVGSPDRESDADEEADRAKMEAALLHEVEVTDGARRQLATDRAQAIEQHLMTAHGIADQRLSLAEPDYSGSAPSVEFELR